MKRISDAYPNAKRIHVILDNLNTHRLKSLTAAYGDVEGRHLWRRFVIPEQGRQSGPQEDQLALHDG
jgi:hypothetical protein